MSSPRSLSITHPHSRRRSSLLDYGGENSINELMKSISRNLVDGSSTTVIANEHHEPDNNNNNNHDDELESLLSLHDDDNIGKSTVFQTVFNCINILVGIGLLSLPLLFKLSGLIIAIFSLILCGVITQFTASLLAECYLRDNKYRNYNELGKKLIGDDYNFIILILFNMDLVGAIIALILLFADSFNTILSIEKVYLKIFITGVLFLLNFLSLRVLSVLSLIGIICTNGIIVITLICGFYKKSMPGSILQPMFTKQSLYPSTLQNFLISISIMMSNFGGHAVLPEFINDMKDPRQSGKSFKISFTFTLLMDIIVGVVAFLMFGDDIKDEFTQNLMMITEGYPHWCNLMITLSLGLLPVSKLPLISRPILIFLENSFNANTFWHRTSIKLGLSCVFAMLSISFDNFGKMMAFLGAFICFTICITLPLLFYLKIFYKELTLMKTCLLISGIALSVLFTMGGTLATVI